MNKKILVLAVLLFAVSAYAQNSDFDIGKYTTPDIVRNKLDFRFDFNSSNLYNNYFSSSRDNRSINSDILSSFSHYVNTRKRVSILTGDLLIVGDYYSSKSKQSSVDNSTIINNVSSLNQQNFLGLTWSNKWYFSESIFMGYGISGSMRYNFLQEKIKNPTEESNQKEKEFGSNISPQLGIGYGRDRKSVV